MNKNTVKNTNTDAETVVVRVRDFAPYIDSDDEYTEVEWKTYISLLKIKASEEYKVTPDSDKTATVKIRVKDFFPDCDGASEYNYVPLGIYDELLRMRAYSSPVAVKDGMIKVRIRDFYPDHNGADVFTEVSPEVYDLLLDEKRRKKREEMEFYRYGSGLRFDEVLMGEMDGICEKTAEDNLMRDELVRKMYRAMRMLPEIQMNRIYNHYILGKTRGEIADSEGVSHSAVAQSIREGLIMLRKLMKKI